MTANRRSRCTSGVADAHCWERTGLHVMDVSTMTPQPHDISGETLCETRRCIWYGSTEAKPYAHGGDKPWRTTP